MSWTLISHVLHMLLYLRFTSARLQPLTPYSKVHEFNTEDLHFCAFAVISATYKATRYRTDQACSHCIIPGGLPSTMERDGAPPG